ncbi:hypothetical protein [Shinella sumterensis]|uniref:Copper resistance protein CopC n=1 Tax=Shinella sumterensis TaxID=1967501 RepID=A0AA50H947_9HYPH|nr:hypothetical protein [Shinella sumterensis]MCD1266881.1 hypothetical protein [Shinella sumterensis]TFE95233.1 hypothetical protein B5M44_22130 [Shinella sumterensis]WLR98599.1 hypothetical protein Q9313_06090 [Shinella sumterensis]
MFVSKSLLPLFLAASLASPALAGPLADAARKAEEQAAAGDPVGAHNTIRDAFGAFAATLPFTIGKAVFVAAPPEGYGMYSTRPTSDFKSGETLISYVEPVGLTWRAGDGGNLESHFTVDFELLDTKGAKLAEQKAFGSFDFKGTVRNQEVFAKLTLKLSGPPAGDYVLRYRFRDTASGAVAISEQPFKIVQ